MSGGEPTAEVAFGTSDPFTLGVEEELFLVDPLTGTQTNSSGAVLEHLEAQAAGEDQHLPGTVERELHASQVELITGVTRDVGEAVAALRRMRGAVLETGTGLLASGTHPSAGEDDSEITDKERYERIRYLIGDAAATPVGALHIHVGMPDTASAIRAFNGLRQELPLLQALAANSPFRHARDTGLASAREVTLRGWPRSGVPRELRDFEDFCQLAAVLSRAADVADYTWFWWKLRPHPRLGTVEVRALDVQFSLADTAALVALVHCLAKAAAEGEVAEALTSELLEEGMFRAARFGVNGELPDGDGRLRPMAELLDSALERAAPHAQELGCGAELDALPGLLRDGGEAGQQRATYELSGMEALLRELTARTAAGR